MQFNGSIWIWSLIKVNQYEEKKRATNQFRQTINKWFPWDSSQKSSGRTVNQIDSQRTCRNSSEPAKASGKSLSRGLAWNKATLLWRLCPVIAPFPTIPSAYHLIWAIPTEQVQMCVRTSPWSYANTRHHCLLSLRWFCSMFPTGISLYECITWCKNVGMQTQDLIADHFPLQLQTSGSCTLFFKHGSNWIW